MVGFFSPNIEKYFINCAKNQYGKIFNERYKIRFKMRWQPSSFSKSLFLQLFPEKTEQNKLLCFKCLERMNSIFNLMSIDIAIEQIISKHQEHFDIQQKILATTINQVVEFQNQVTLIKQNLDSIFKIMDESILEWKSQLQSVTIQPIEFNLEQELSKINLNQGYLSRPYVNDNIRQLQENLSNQILENFYKVNQEIDQNKIQLMLEKVKQEYIKFDFYQFPYAQEFIDEIDSILENISCIDLNFDNTLIFVGSKHYLSSIQTKDGFQQTKIFYKKDSQFTNISGSKTKNLVIASFENICGLWLLDDIKVWKNYAFFTNNKNIQFLSLNQNESQIILACSNQTSILQINDTKKSLIFIQSISLNNYFTSLHINNSLSKLLIWQSNSFTLYKQRGNQWIKSENVELQKNENIEAVKFIRNDDIIIKYKIGQYQTQIRFYEQSQLIKVDDKSINLQFESDKFQFFPQALNSQRNIYLQQMSNGYVLIRQEKYQFDCWTQNISFPGQNAISKWSNDGKILIICDPKTSKIRLHKLKYY